jgi:copper chaperone
MRMQKEFKIEGMSCNHCVKEIEKSLSGINVNRYDVKIGSAKVGFDENEIKEEAIIEAIRKLGYKVLN